MIATSLSVDVVVISPMNRQCKDHCEEHEPCLENGFLKFLDVAIKTHRVDTV